MWRKLSSLACDLSRSLHKDFQMITMASSKARGLRESRPECWLLCLLLCSTNHTIVPREEQKIVPGSMPELRTNLRIWLPSPLSSTCHLLGQEISPYSYIFFFRNCYDFQDIYHILSQLYSHIGDALARVDIFLPITANLLPDRLGSFRKEGITVTSWGSFKVTW